MRVFSLVLAMVAVGATAQTTVAYEPTHVDIVNPERGMYGSATVISETDLSWIRNRGYSLVHGYVRLDPYRETALPGGFLDSLRASLAVVRDDDLKIVLRFSYNFGAGEPDATLDRILGHIDQLAPVLTENADVIYALQAGFIGAWGEWHTSTNGNETPEARAAVLGALLDALPQRQVLLRYPGDMLEQFPEPIAAEDAHSGSDHSRMGHHNDCVLANEEDAGTYWPPSQAPEFKAYLDAATQHLIVGGETCQVTPALQRTDCPTALAEFERFRWSFLNDGFWSVALNRWRTEGCYDEIRRRMGYRYRLVTATLPASVQAGGPLALTLRVANDGFAGFRTPRAMEVMLAPEEGGEWVRLDTGAEARDLFPDGGEEADVPVNVTLPPDLAPGRYRLGLALPDPAPTLRSRPAYAVRLANEGTWIPALAANDLLATVDVTAATTSTSDTPGRFALSVAENPARGVARLLGLGVEAGEVVVVLDARGRQVWRSAPLPAGGWMLEIPDLAPGVYVARIVGATGNVRFTIAR
ncbi:MAG: DUF4832 domain-containing protein [Bacteroidota bacterium]